jgi:1-acyl-sn-glycerol-3-phosphate acyltransferase
MHHPIERDKPMVEFLRNYHRHEIIGLENLEPFYKDKKQFFLVGNHGFNFTEPALLMHGIYDRFKTFPRPVGHYDLFFRVKSLVRYIRRYGVISHLDFRSVRKAIVKGRSLLIYPGGEDEAMYRNYMENPYKLVWMERPGFAKLAIKYEVPVVFVAALGIDEMVFQSKLNLPDWIIKMLNISHPENFQNIKIFWNGFFPAPVKIKHIITEPINLFGEEKELKNKEYIVYKLKWLQNTCQKRLDSMLAFDNEKMSDPLGASIQTIQSIIRKMGL